MKTFITSDTHFGHKNIIKFCPNTRGHFLDTNHMELEMIRMWNEIVSQDDIVYMLGDVAFMQPAEAVGVLNRLNGFKILIEGNHDKKLLRHPGFHSCFREVHKYLTIDYNGIRVVMFHFPILEWDQMHYGSVHFYGHVHQNLSGLEQYRARNVGFDSTGKIVWLLDDAIADALKGDIKSRYSL